MKPMIGGSFRMGDDASSYETEAKGQFAAPQGGGRQALSKPDRGGSISFGTDKAEFATSAGTAFDGGKAASAARAAAGEEDPWTVSGPGGDESAPPGVWVLTSPLVIG